MENSNLTNATAERALIGLAMSRPTAYDDALVAPEDFEISLARACWGAIGDLRRKGHDVTPISVRESLPHMDSGMQVLSTLLEWTQAGSFETAEALGRLIRKSAIARRLAASCAQTLDDLKRGDLDVEDILGEHRGTVAGIESAE